MLPGEKTQKKTGKGWEIPERAMEVLISFDGNIIYKIGEFSSLPCLMKGITNHQPGRILFRVFPWDWVSLGESLVDHFWNITWPVRLWFRQSGHLRKRPTKLFSPYLWLKFAYYHRAIKHGLLVPQLVWWFSQLHPFTWGLPSGLPSSMVGHIYIYILSHTIPYYPLYHPYYCSPYYPILSPIISI